MARPTTHSFAGGKITATFLQQIGSPGVADTERDAQIAGVADIMTSFISGTRSSLDMAVYDLRLDGAPGERVAAALAERKKAGVVIRIAHDPTTSPNAPAAMMAGATPKPPGAENYLTSLAPCAEIRSIRGFGALMHNKYMIRDGLTAEAAILTGSTNFTNDAWGLQENNILVLASQPLSTYYAADFNDLWLRGKITEKTGAHDTGTVAIDTAKVTVAFTPGESATVVRDVVHAIESAKRRIAIAAMVMSSGPILAAISEAIDRGVIVSGLYDGPQMDTVLAQWKAAGIGMDKSALVLKLQGRLSRKNSIPYAPDVPHNFMHLKVIVADDSVVTGSYNFSNHARGNAENLLVISDAAVADAYAGWIGTLAALYSRGGAAKQG